MRKLVIGCGYLGRRVAAAWLRRGDEVFALTRSRDHADELRAAGIKPVIGDVTEPRTLGALPRVDGMLYAVGFDRSAGQSQREVAVVGLQNVLAEIHDRVNRLIYISSTSVYGQSAGEWIDESSPAEPVTSNGQVCRDAERVVEKHFPPDESTETATANVLRLAGLYGPGRLLRRVDALNSGSPISGNPDGWLNLIHVDDAVNAVCACEQRGKPGATYLICDGRPLRRRDYFERLAVLVGAGRPVFESTNQSTRAAAGLNKRCRNNKLRTELVVELQFPTIETGLPNAVEQAG
jgi:nucleoside-diphosphate-sugar epimerase